MLACRRLSASYGGGSHCVLRDVSLQVSQGEIVGILGPNGSGKSSLLNAIGGRLTMLSGTITLMGRDVGNAAPPERARMGLRVFPQGGRVFADLSVEENLRVAASCLPAACGKDIGLAYKWFDDLVPRAATRAGLLSGGQRQMLSLAMVLLYSISRQPCAFLLDEPSGGLDPPHCRRLADILSQTRTAWHAVLVAEENAVFARNVCSRFYRFSEPGLLEEITA